MKTREIRLKSRPAGLPTSENFELGEVDFPGPAEGEVVFQNTWVLVDPYMRGRMDAGDSYIPPFEVGVALEGGALGRIVDSRHPDFANGTLVESMFGWREHFLHKRDGATGMFAEEGGIQRRDPDLVRPQTYLGIAGMPGLTAYTGLLTVGALRKVKRYSYRPRAARAVPRFARSRKCTVAGSSAARVRPRKRPGW